MKCGKMGIALDGRRVYTVCDGSVTDAVLGYSQTTKGAYTMKLIGKLKENVDQAETREEKKELIEKAGVVLTDDELEKVAGGIEEFGGYNDPIPAAVTLDPPEYKAPEPEGPSYIPPSVPDPPSPGFPRSTY